MQGNRRCRMAPFAGFDLCPRVVLCVLLPLGLPACAEPGSDAGWTVSVDTLPSGAVHVVNEPPQSGGEPTWILEPELRIGTVEGSGPHVFGQLLGLRVAEDGRIAVLDGQAQEVRIFGPDGRHRATYGGRGGGPGEFEGAYGLMTAPDGTLWVPDHRNARMSVLDLDEGFRRSYPFPVMSYGFVWGGAMTTDGRVLKPSFRPGPERRRALLVYDDGMNLVDSVPLPQPPEVDREDPPGAFYFGSSEGWGYVGVPYYPRGEERLDSRGDIWSTAAGDPAYRIARWTPGGDTTLVLETRRPPVPVTEAERDSVIDDLRERLLELGGARQDWSKIPQVKPAVASIFTAEDGGLWVRTNSPDTLLHYDVYERDGRWVGTAATGLDVLPWIAPVVRGDQFWAVVTDELDVPHVVRARIVEAEGGGDG